MIEATWRQPREFPSALAQTRTPAECLRDEIASRPGRIAVVDGSTALTVEQLGVECVRWQRRLVRAGVGRGAVVAVQLPNWWETVAVAFAAWGLGAVINLLTPIYRGRDLRVLFEMRAPGAVVVPAHYRGTDHAEMMRAVLADCGIDAAVIEVRGEGAGAGATPGTAPTAEDFEVRPVSPDDVCMLMYTSGTTGRPKGVLHTSRSLLVEAASIAEVFGVSRGSIFMPSPLTHVTGLLYGVLMPVLAESGVVLLDRWDPEVALSLIEEHRCGMTVAATPFLRGLTDAYRAAERRCSLRSFVCGGADIPPSLIAEAEQVLGTRISRTYGSTEFPTLCTVHPGSDPAVHAVTDGTPIGDAEARLVGGHREGAGELEVSGPEMFAGYLDPSDNESAITPDGWFRTGDLARIDPGGNLTIVGRVKDLIIRGGENISAKEVEDLLIQFPAVQDVAIVGFPDDVLGERVCAVVVSDDDAFGLASLVGELRDSGVAMQKLPEALMRVDRLPRTASGKVQKFELRALVETGIAEGAVELRPGIGRPADRA
ncbi:AMP-binding protein [Leucobacter weissii]|uniref:AMP-binding protein n=1 Tax=Leucobacter weissii TaxID=1983706 RepID=A0A939MIH4_9MICO|nr:AMP-binding protein [Leucobacter weissii]MBO1901548.1 AMP-binding protein [Leucobacter weissii]